VFPSSEAVWLTNIEEGFKKEEKEKKRKKG